MKMIFLSDRVHHAAVSDRDYAKFSAFVWHFQKNRSGVCYAYRRAHRGSGGKVYMHREIVGAPEGVEVDHRNGNGLDNRRMNLRVATPKQNRANHGLVKNNRSGCSGVWFDRERGKWQVKIGRKALGRFDTYMEACAARCAAEKKEFGSFARR